MFLSIVYKILNIQHAISARISVYLFRHLYSLRVVIEWRYQAANSMPTDGNRSKIEMVNILPATTLRR